MDRHGDPYVATLLSRAPALRLVSLCAFVVAAASQFAVRAENPASGAVLAPTSAAADFFEAKIRPLLLARCVECHGAKKQESGLRLDSRDGILKGNDEGPVVLLTKPERSRLLLAVRHEGDIEMPP